MVDLYSKSQVREMSEPLVIGQTLRLPGSLTDGNHQIGLASPYYLEAELAVVN
jgi:hypothetical protein